MITRVYFRNTLYIKGPKVKEMIPHQFYFSYIKSDKATYFSFIRKSYLSYYPSDLMEEFSELEDNNEPLDKFEEFERYDNTDDLEESERLTYYHALPISDILKTL